MRSLSRLALFSLLWTVSSNTAFSQVTILEPDTVFLCEPGDVTLHAIYELIDSSQLVAAEALQNQDDVCSGVIDIGFPFTFYGNTYTQCILSTNGYIQFDLTDANGYSPWVIGAPIPSPADPVNAIMGPWQDTYPIPGFPGWITYTTTGVAPNRIFIFNMCQVPMFSCTDLCFSTQTKLYESTNVIEFHIGHKDLCTTWNSGQAILGVQNDNGTLATVVNGYNANVLWTADNEGWQLTPNGPNDFSVLPIAYDPIPVYAPTQLQWTMNGAPQGNGDSTVINIGQSGYVSVGFAGCFGLGAGGCGGTGTTSGADSIFIMIDELPTVTSQRVSACNDSSDNALFAEFTTNPNGPFDLTWSSGGVVLEVDSNVLNGDSLTQIPAGSYHLEIENIHGCTFDFDYAMPVHNMTAGFTYDPPLVCQYVPVNFTNTSTGSITSYTWSFGDNHTGLGQDIEHIYYGYGDSMLVTMTVANDSFPSCEFSHSEWLDVNPNIVAHALIDSPHCAGVNIRLWDRSWPHPVSWQWIENDSLISTDSTAKFRETLEGAYNLSLIVTDSLCGSDTLNDVIFIHPFPVVFLGNDTLLCPGETIDLDAGNPGMEYNWSTGHVTQTVSLAPSTTTPVSVEVNNMGCHTTDNMLITMNCSMLFPNAFTPNGDGVNDYFLPHLINMRSYDFFVYNRWGQLIFSSTGNTGDAGEGWNGLFNGEIQPVASYVYYAQGIDIKDQPVKTMGSFVLMR